MNTQILLTVATCYMAAYGMAQQGDARNVLSNQEIIESLRQRIDNGDIDAISEIGALRDTNAIPILERLVTESIQTGDPNKLRRETAVRTLVQLGAEKYYATRIETLANVDTADARIATIRAFEVLASMRTTNAVCVVANSLFGAPKVSIWHGDVKYPSNEVLAASALSRMVKSSTAPRTTKYGTKEDIQKWREWWLQNKNRFEQ